MADIYKAAYYHGSRLWENLQGWAPSPAAGAAEHAGVTRLMGVINPDSPNFIINLAVSCSVRPVTAYDDLDRQTTLNASLNQKGDELMALAQTLGPVSWCQDDSQEGGVSSSYSASGGVQAVAHGALGGSWTTEVGRYVLVRNPTTGAGFVVVIQSRTAGSVTIDVEQDLTTDWEITNVQLHYPSCRYVTMSTGGTDAPSGDFHRTGGGVDYQFRGAARLVLAADHQQDLG